MTVRGVDVRGIVWGGVGIRPDRFTLVLTALAVLGGVLVLSRQVAYGVGVEWDSINYLSAARSLLAGEGFVQVIQEVAGAYARWPPLYPMLLAASGFLVFDPWDVAGPLNAIIFGVTVFVAGRWLRRRIRSQILVVWACLAVMLAIPLTRAASYAMSETPFILFTTLSLVWIDKFVLDGKRTDLVWAAVFTALACFTRYIGVAVLVAVVPLLLLRPGVALMEKVKQCVAYVLISLIPVGLWILRNVMQVGEPFGPRELPDYTLVEALDSILGDLSRWVIFLPTTGVVRLAAVLLVGAALFALAAAVGYVVVRSSRRDSPLRGWSSFSVFGGFALVYLVSLTALGTVTSVWPLSGRMIAPVYIPLLFAGVFALDKFMISARIGALRGKALDLPIVRTILRGRKPVSLLMAVIVVAGSLWLLGHAPRHARDIWLANGDLGQGFASSKWVDSEVLQYMRDTSIESPRVLSSVPIAVLYATGVREYVYLSQELDAARRKIDAASDGDHVVWFRSHTVGYLYGDGDLRVLPELEVVADLPDGVIFRIVEEAR